MLCGNPGIIAARFYCIASNASVALLFAEFMPSRSAPSIGVTFTLTSRNLFGRGAGHSPPRPGRRQTKVVSMVEETKRITLSFRPEAWARFEEIGCDDYEAAIFLRGLVETGYLAQLRETLALKQQRLGIKRLEEQLEKRQSVSKQQESDRVKVVVAGALAEHKEALQ